jgi:sugar fermentation stimulation protein A
VTAAPAPYLLQPRAPLLEARFTARFDRFIAELTLADGQTIRAHCVNPGRMEGLVVPGARAWVSKVPEDSKRKLRYTLELLEVEGRVIGANTVVPNWLAEQLLLAGVIPGLRRFRSLRAEVPYGTKSRIDFWLETATGPHLVEVKNCHLVYPDGRAYFPDSVSARATEHLEALMDVVEDGAKATVLFVIQRDDANALRPSDLHDPRFAETARIAATRGVNFKAVALAPDPGGWTVLGPRAVDLKPYDAQKLAPYRAAFDAHSGWQRGPRAPKAPAALD